MKKGDTTAHVNTGYNQMEWIFGENSPGVCGHNIPAYLPDYVTCVRTHHRDAKVWTFHENEDRKLTSEIQKLVETYPPDPETFDSEGYQQPCKGDSGGGHWMQGGQSGVKQVLIGVSTTAPKPCGLFSKMEKINNKEALSWIRYHYWQ